jgi:hypothetical protein
VGGLDEAPFGAAGAAELLAVAAADRRRAGRHHGVWPGARARLSEAQLRDRTDAMAVASPATAERGDPQRLQWFSRMDAARPRRMLWRP